MVSVTLVKLNQCVGVSHGVSLVESVLNWTLIVYQELEIISTTSDTSSTDRLNHSV